MQFSPEQEAALKDVQRWYRDKSSQVYYLAGYAGTGKTTLARHFAEHIDGLTLFAAYTGKAAHVMRTRGQCPGASTIHQLIYAVAQKGSKRLDTLLVKYREAKKLFESFDENDMQARFKRLDALQRMKKLHKQVKDEQAAMEQPHFNLKDESRLSGAALLVVDECSMVDTRMGEDLLSFGKPILVLGDPAQLPPVRSRGYFTKHRPNKMLTDIHRQALDSPVLRMATDVRQGKKLEISDYGEGSGVFSKKLTRDLDRFTGDLQVICGRNETRIKANAAIRKHRGAESCLPEEGDRVICLQNDHDKGIFNGGMFSIDKVLSCPHAPHKTDGIEMRLRSQDEADKLVEVNSVAGYFMAEDMLNVKFFLTKGMQRFDYGYMITCHKAQGSEWPHVAVMNESDCFAGKERAWLYTAITRASDRVEVYQ